MWLLFVNGKELAVVHNWNWFKEFLDKLNDCEYVTEIRLVRREVTAECSKCEEVISQVEFRRNQGLCDKCYREQKLKEGEL